MLFTPTVALAILGFVGSVFSSPAADIVARGRGDTAREAIPAALNCAGIESTCNMNCKAILCHGKSPIMKRDSAAGDRHYRDSGAGTGPFRERRISMARRGVARLDNTCVSAEEFPWESTTQGGTGALVAGVPFAQQNLQGGRIQTMYRSYNVPNGKWFHVYYRGGNQALMPYCQALYSRPPNTAVCDKDDKKYRLKNLIFTRDSAAKKFVHFAKASLKKIKRRDEELLADAGPELPQFEIEEEGLVVRDDSASAERLASLNGQDDPDHDTQILDYDKNDQGPELIQASSNTKKDATGASVQEARNAEKRSDVEMKDVEWWNDDPHILYSSEELGY